MRRLTHLIPTGLGRTRATLAAMVLAGCGPGKLPAEDIPSTLRITLGQGSRSGCIGDGPPLDILGEDLTFRVEALDRFNQLFPYSGPVRFHISPGHLEDTGLRLSMAQGVLVVPPEAPLGVLLAFGPTHVWAELVGEGGRQATGMSPELCFKDPKVSDVQRSESSHNTIFEGQQVKFRGDRLVATATDSKGFFFTDVDATEYNSMYVFTFGNPTGVKPGSCLCEVSGAVEEFLHFTQISFPTWRVFYPGGREAAAVELEHERVRVGDDEVPDPRGEESVVYEECQRSDFAACSLADSAAREALTVPDPIRLDPESLPDVGVPPWEDQMVALDRHEASLVAIGPVHLPRQFTDCDFNKDGDVSRCFSRDCPALANRGLSERDVRDLVCKAEDGDDQDLPGGCQCTCNELKESFCTNDCAVSPGCAENAAYRKYGQFGVTVGDGDRRMNLVTQFGLPDFEPTKDPHTTIHCVVGNLKQVAAAPIPWVIQPRRPSDVIFDPPASIEDDPCAKH